MKLSIVGSGVLANTARQCCADLVGNGMDLVWICEDTPIDHAGVPDNEAIVAWIAEVVRVVPADVPVLISSQVPVGTTRKLEAMFPGRDFAHSPENIRVAHAVEDFREQARVVVGQRTSKHMGLFRELFGRFTDNIVFTDPETAEFSKHALNAYLGMCIAFANELSRVCPLVGADMATITHALRTERRVSPHAPLLAGPPFSSGHLERDLHTLARLARENGIALPLLTSILPSNDARARTIQQS